jgi:hypothetical protein
MCRIVGLSGHLELLQRETYCTQPVLYIQAHIAIDVGHFLMSTQGD